MGTDFMPRLTAAANDHGTLNRLVNEQTEMGVLIAVPGVLATLTLAPWVMKIFYSGAFVIGADVVRWQILGVFLRVVSWPLGYVLIAKGKSLLFTLSELGFGIINVALILICMKYWRLEGIGVSFALSYFGYTLIMVIAVSRLTGFRWSPIAFKLLILAIASLGIIFCCTRLLSEKLSTIIGLVSTSLATVTCLLGMQKLLGINLWQRVLGKLMPR
jgi:PST family polysaccharide transporter